MSPSPSIFIDFPQEGGARQTLALRNPTEVLSTRDPGSVRPLLRRAETLAAAGAWVAGFLSYEAAPAFDAAFQVHPPQPGLPLLWFGVFDTALGAEALPAPAGLPHAAWQPGIDRTRFDRDIASILEAIGAGTIFQVNYTFPLHAGFCGDPAALFAQLRAAQPGGYLACIDTGDFSILSASPELFFRREGDLVTAKPMKGTARRGRWQEEDDARAQWLQSSAKNRAENLMIVDVLRNDLSRIAQKGSVKVPALFNVERHPTVLQMTSTVNARLRPGAGIDDIFAALFPCASVTGAPKIKATEIIRQLESGPRGVYCGAVGLMQPGADAIFNVPIRTVSLDRRQGHGICGIGSGIVWDSQADDEYDEVLLKSRFLAGAPAAFDILETLGYRAGEWTDLPRHLDRLAASARFFTRPFDAAGCRELLEEQARHAGAAPMRVRILLDENAVVRTQWAPAPDPVAEPAAFIVATRPVDSSNPWLYHKTTRREVYEQAVADLPEGVFDALLWNERGELTEFTRGNLVIDIDGERLTPPGHCGLLNGCLRAAMVASGAVREAVLRPDDLERADAVWFVNSLRGCIRMQHQA